MSFNLVVLVGNVVRDPEVKQVSNGKSLAKMSIATNEKWRDRQGQEQQRTEYHNVVIWGALSAIAFKLRKGSQVTIFGKIKTRSYEDRQGQKKYVTEIIADRVVTGQPEDNPGDNYDDEPEINF